MTAPAEITLSVMAAAVWRAHDRQRGVAAGEAIGPTLPEAEEKALVAVLGRAARTFDRLAREDAAALRGFLGLPERIKAAIRDGAAGLAQLYGGDPAPPPSPGPSGHPAPSTGSGGGENTSEASP